MPNFSIRCGLPAFKTTLVKLLRHKRASLSLPMALGMLQGSLVVK